MTEGEWKDRVLVDREAKLLIGTMLALQVTLLLSTLLWT